jgi:hypothetical protein
MRSTQFVMSFVLIALVGGTLCIVFTMPAQNDQQSNQFSGEWEGKFQVNGTATPFTLELKVDGNKVTGRVASNHTGPGVITNGSLANGKLQFRLEFKSHEAIEMTAALKDDRLVGEFRTEGFVANWEATRKGQTGVANQAKSSNAAAVNSSDSISGAWDANLTAEGTTVPLSFDLKATGDQVTGTTNSEHLGENTIENGSWMDNKLQFAFTAHGITIKLIGSLKDGRLVGEFNASNGMQGQWEATRK